MIDNTDVDFSAQADPYCAGPTALTLAMESWPRREPFAITGYVFETADCVRVDLQSDGCTGRGEGAGVYFLGETPQTMAAQIEAVRARIEAGISRETLRGLLPPGGARNALDCALWDLESKLTGQPVWQRAGVPDPKPLLTTFTCGVDVPEKMAAAARAFPSPRAIKLKLNGDAIDAERVTAVRSAMPEAWLSVDANQGFTLPSLEKLMPVLESSNVQMIEQPFPLGQDALLDGFESPIPIAADESVQSIACIPGLAQRYDLINIKLDKCGGLTEALKMAERARSLDLGVMVGCMGGTSLAMAPAFVLGQLCDIVDLDAPQALSRDHVGGVRYEDGSITIPNTFWGHPL